MLQTSTASRVDELSPVIESVDVQRLENSDAAEILEFLSQRPIHTVTMMSMISR